MVDPTTPNRSLRIPTHGSDVDTWDVPMNANSSALDTITGGVASISATGGTITLNAAQLACGTLLFSGNLTSTGLIVFPSVQGWWTIENMCSGTSSFNLRVTAGVGTENIAIPPGCMLDIQINGDVVRFRNLPMVGSYMGVAGSVAPLWLSGCTKPPYLLCNGGSFSSGTYPFLSTILGGTTLPDARGRGPFYLNQGTGRLTAAGAGIDGDTLLAVGGANGVTLTANQIPTITAVNANQAISVNSTNLIPSGGSVNTIGTPGSGTPVTFISGPSAPASQASSATNSISATYTNSSQQVVGNAAPGFMAGLLYIRAG